MIPRVGPTDDEIRIGILNAASSLGLRVDLLRLQWYEQWVRSDGDPVGDESPGDSVEYVLVVDGKAYRPPFDYRAMAIRLAPHAHTEAPLRASSPPDRKTASRPSSTATEGQMTLW